MPNLLSTLILFPMLAAFLVALLPAKTAKPMAVALSLVPLALTGLAFSQFNPQGASFQLAERLPWLPQAHIEYFLAVDGISLAFIALTALLTPLCLLASWNVKDRPSLFFALFLALESLVIGVFCALDLILFYIFFEASLIPMYLLIGIWGGEQRIEAALKFFLYTFAGSILMLVASLYLFKLSGTFDLTLLPNLHIDVETQKWLWLAFFAAFAVKIPMVPLHTWLPSAHVQAPTAGSVILAGILLKLGAYGFLRVSLPILPEASVIFGPFVFALSGIAVVYAALVAYAQTDIKKLIAYSSVSHMGLVTLALFAGTVTSLHGGLLVMLNHGLVSAGLFLAVGVIYERLHTRELAKFGGLVKFMPGYAFTVMVLTLAAVALPGTNSFVGEFLSLAGSWPISKGATIAATSGVIFGALYMLWLYRKMIFGTPSTFVEEHHHHLPDMSWREWVLFLPLLMLIPLLGIFPSLAQNLWQQPVERLADTMAQARINLMPGENLAPLPTQAPSSTIPTPTLQEATTQEEGTN